MGWASSRRANLRGIHDFTTEIEGQLVGGLDGGIKAGHPDAIIMIGPAVVIEVEVVERRAEFYHAAGRWQSQTRIIVASGASTERAEFKHY